MLKLMIFVCVMIACSFVSGDSAPGEAPPAVDVGQPKNQDSKSASSDVSSDANSDDNDDDDVDDDDVDDDVEEDDDEGDSNDANVETIVDPPVV